MMVVVMETVLSLARPDAEPVRGTQSDTQAGRLEVELASTASYRQARVMPRVRAKHGDKGVPDRRRSEALASDLREVTSALVRRLRAESSGQALSMSQGEVLVRLHKSGSSTVADLARAERVTPQSMGTTVGSLEEAGLVARTADPNDARRWDASLTEAGKRVLLEGRAARQAWLSRALQDRLGAAEQARLAEAIELLRKVLGE
jgi:DNA-binding MarR family transcriptional regulator